MSKSSSIVIAGAGAAGMAAAISAARRGKKAILLEQNRKAGKKIRVSGNGRCNIGNLNISSKFYHCSDPAFVKRVLAGYDAGRIVEFLRSVGIETKETEEGRLFPMGEQAGSVVELLLRECQRLNVDIVYECKILGIDRSGDIFAVKSSRGVYECKNIIIAMGSPAAPQLGGSTTGMDIVHSLGHGITPPLPALTPLESRDRWPAKAAGVKLPARAVLYSDKMAVSERRGDLLFTDYGVSGLAILDISRDASLRLAAGESCRLSIDLMPQFSKEQLVGLLSGHIDKERDLPMNLWLEGVIHRKLVPVLIERSGLSAHSEKELNRKSIGQLVYAIKNLELSISGSRDFKYAEVATGGVDTKNIDPETMGSKLVSGLYFAGEIIDVDGDRGGFNFHWAWSTGMRAGKAV